MTTRFAPVLALLCVATVTRAAESGKVEGKSKAPKMVVVTPTDAKWMDIQGPVKGVQVATLRGNFAKGAYATFIKFPAGTDNPLHSHTNTLRSVVVSGTFYTGEDATSAKDLVPGTYVETPGGWKHVSGCRPGAECILYVESSGKFDFKPVKAAK